MSTINAVHIFLVHLIFKGNPSSSIRNENRKTVNPVGPTRTAVKNTSKTPSIRRPAQPIRSKKKISDKGKISKIERNRLGVNMVKPWI